MRTSMNDVALFIQSREEASPFACMTGRSCRLRLHQNCVAIAVYKKSLHVQRVTGCFAFSQSLFRDRLQKCTLLVATVFTKAS